MRVDDELVVVLRIDFNESVGESLGVGDGHGFG